MPAPAPSAVRAVPSTKPRGRSSNRSATPSRQAGEPLLLIVGWDGACFEVSEPLRAAGRMPALDALLARGRSLRVRSTVPAVTFPAWTSFLTGTSPDRHGITDFTIPR